jgi:hypothetical protein
MRIPWVCLLRESQDLGSLFRAALVNLARLI